MSAATIASDYFRDLGRLLAETEITVGSESRSLDQGCSEIVDLLLTLKGSSRKAMVIGNGGSAAIASHIQNDLFKAVGVRAIAFNEQPLLTALANDEGYPAVFERPVRRWPRTGTS